jgi:hypothetical protein
LAEEDEEPQKTLVTRSMTLVPLLGDWGPEAVALEAADEEADERRPRPLMRLVSSALARSTTPCAEMDISRKGPLHFRAQLAQNNTV